MSVAKFLLEIEMIENISYQTLEAVLISINKSNEIDVNEIDTSIVVDIHTQFSHD